MRIVKHNPNKNIVSNQAGFLPAQPLWQRVPTRDEHGQLLGDFMMFIPRLKHYSTTMMQEVLAKIEKILSPYQQYVMYVDINLKTNTLWISHKQIPGLGLEIAAVIHHVIPEAKLVAQHYE